VAFEVRTGPRGPAAFWEGRQLTSAYDAGREARQWAESVSPAQGSLVFVVGDSLGLVSAALKRRGALAAPGGRELGARGRADRVLFG
jgi:hypothetical protein